MSSLPPVRLVSYNRFKNGYFGELGSGADARIRFLQSAVTKDELDNISLIEQISGSERWKVQDLFQRDVDMNRVQESILPYLQDKDKVKFFNPLTLVLMPIDSSGGVDASVTFVEPKDVEEGEHHYTQYERKDLFSFKVHGANPAFSELHWNDAKVKLVAIDGQHRLSALKFWKSRPGPTDLDTWQIPVVILGIFRADSVPAHEPASLLEIVRTTFVYINSRAEEVNEARRILLDDERVQAVCTQELVQASHCNDCLPTAERSIKKLPLMFFDWRGQVRWKKGEGIDVSAPGSVLSISEVFNCLDEYVLGDTPNTVLQLEDLDPPMSENYLENGVLNQKDTARIRDRFNHVLYPGLSSLLEGFAPFSTYVQRVRALETHEASQSEASVHAFQKLRFGSHQAPPGQMSKLADESYDKVIDQLGVLRKDCFDELVDREIGLRAIISAFARLKTLRDSFAGQTLSWANHAEWFIPKLNKVYQDGWFKDFNALRADQRKALTHVCFDASGSIVNYKLTDVPKGLGALLALLITRQDLGALSAEDRTEIWETFGDVLESTVRKGCRREQKAILRDTFQGSQQQFIDKVNDEAEKKVVRQLNAMKAWVVSRDA